MAEHRPQGIVVRLSAGRARSSLGPVRAIALGLPLGIAAFFISPFVAASLDSSAGKPGAATVIDGDTLHLGTARVRLYGIDAPEIAQWCKDQRGREWACGEAAKSALEKLLAGKSVECHGRGQDDYGRLLAVCTADGREFNASLVKQGLAWAFVRYSKAYAGLEQEAKSARRGVFAADNTPPWDFRANRWSGATRTTEADQARSARSRATSRGRASASITCPGRTVTTALASTSAKVSGGSATRVKPSAPVGDEPGSSIEQMLREREQERRSPERHEQPPDQASPPLGLFDLRWAEPPTGAALPPTPFPTRCLPFRPGFGTISLLYVDAGAPDALARDDGVPFDDRTNTLLIYRPPAAAQMAKRGPHRLVGRSEYRALRVPAADLPTTRSLAACPPSGYSRIRAARLWKPRRVLANAGDPRQA